MDAAWVDKTFGDADRRSCVPIIEKLLWYANLARRYGMVMLLDKVRERESDPLLLKGIALIVDGTHPDLVGRVVRNYACLSGFEGAALLQNMMMAEGLRLLQGGANPAIMRTVLCSYLGIGGEAIYEQLAGEPEPVDSLEAEFIEKYAESAMREAWKQWKDQGFPEQAQDGGTVIATYEYGCSDDE